MKKILANYQSVILYSLLYIFFFSFALGQLQKVSLPVGSLYVHDLVICLYIIANILLQPSAIKQTLLQIIKIIKQHPLISISVMLVAGHSLLAGLIQQSALPFLYITRLSVYSFFILLIHQAIDVKTIKYSWLLTILGILYLGLLQYFLFPDTRVLANLGWDDHYYRLISTLLDPAFTGILFVFGIMSFFQKDIFKLINLIPVCLLSIGLTLTYSRSSWLALAVSCLVLVLNNLWLKKNVSQMLLGIFIILAIMLSTFFFAPKPGGEGVNVARTSTIVGRASALKTELPTNLTELLIGKGLFISNQENSSIPYHPQVPDNSFIMILKGGGAITLLLYCLGLLQIVKKNIGQPIQQSLFIGLLIHSLFSASIIQPFVFLAFWGLYTSTNNKS